MSSSPAAAKRTPQEQGVEGIREADPEAVAKREPTATRRGLRGAGRPQPPRSPMVDVVVPSGREAAAFRNGAWKGSTKADLAALAKREPTATRRDCVERGGRSRPARRWLMSRPSGREADAFRNRAWKGSA